jgi:hypothetical protein
MEAAEIDKELEEVERRSEHLRALYEQYFMGMERIEPLVQRRDVERRILGLRREKLRNTAQRFKFNTLVQRFNTMQTHWSRVVREIENGTYRRDVIRAAARFGEGAIALLGKKKTKDLVAAVARVQARRPVDEPLELASDDLIEEEEVDEDEAPTPPKLGGVAPAPMGLGQVDLPTVGTPVNRGAAAPALPGLGPLPLPLPPPKRAEVRLDPASPIRQAATEPKPLVVTEKTAPGFGELDLDFEDAPPVRVPPLPAAAPVPRASPPVPRVGLAAPLDGGSAPRPPRPLPPVAAPPAAKPVAPRAPAPMGFGELDLPLDEVLATVASPALKVPAPGATSATTASIRSGVMAAPRPLVRPAAVAPPAPIAPKPAHDAAASVPKPFDGGAASGAKPRAPAEPSAEGDLADQRIRQIYAKYVETKRSTQESTAGITFEKLATSLRAQASKLRSAHPEKSVDYEVVVKDGKTHLKPVLR